MKRLIGLTVLAMCAGEMARGELPTGRFAREMPASTYLAPLAPSDTEMRTTFRDPFGKVRTGCYWYWLAGNVSCEGVRRDLEAMKRAGIDLAFIGDIKDGPAGKVRTLSPEWEKALATAFETASELGVELGIFNSPGWAQSGGPWISHTRAMRRLAQSETRVTGPRKGPIALPLPDLAGRPANEWQDVAVVAYPVPANATGMLKKAGCPFAKGADGRYAVEFESARPFTAQSIRLNPKSGRLSCTVRVEAFKDGRFVPVGGETLCSRINDHLNVGFLPTAPAVGTFAPVTSTRFRVVAVGFWRGGPKNVESVELLAAPGIFLAYEKSLARMYEATLPPWKHYMWPDEPSETPGSAFDPARAVVLTDRLGSDGRLAWDVPAGEWTIFRYVMTPTGTKNAPANPEATGYEVDKLSREHIAYHFDSYLGKMLDRTPEAHRRAIGYAIIDSYEQGGQNATDGFAARFKASFGYDPTPYYPACFGTAVASRDISDRFLWDLRRFVADEVAYSYVGGLRTASGRRGLKLWLENYGHWGFPGEFLQYGGQSDAVGGEFWSGGRSIDEVRAAASCAHTYGKREVWCESHTTGSLRFGRGPMDHKLDADRHFSEGVNATVLHVYVQQNTERLPGNIAWFGNEFNRHNTWFEHFDLFTGYMKRAGYLLRLGQNVADVAYFIGEDAPKMTGPHTPKLPAGRQYDFINAEVLCEAAGVDAEGRIVLPDGTRYEVLALPPQTTMRPQMLERLERLVNAGAFALGPKPLRSPSLAGQPAADARVREIADRLWGEVDGKRVKSARRGKGTIAWNLSLDEALKLRGSAADVIHDGRFAFAHRTLPNAEIYFLTPRDGKPVKGTELSFRTAGRVPEIWDAATGEIRPVEAWRQEGNRTVVTLSLARCESAFVVFARDARGATAARNDRRTAVTEVAGPWQLTFQSDALHRGPAKPVVAEKLFDFATADDPAIKYYSGKVVYRTTFTAAVPKDGQRLTLDLGDVAVTAKVRVNGRDAGGVCFAPYRLDVTPFVKDGVNDLEVEVCNLWVNRLIGDAGKRDRPTWTSLPVRGYRRPVKSGLIGPVRINTPVCQ